MRILLDARAAFGGIARYVSALHAGLAAGLPAGSVRTFGSASLGWGAERGRAAPAWKRVFRPVAGTIARVSADCAGLPLRAALGRADLFHATFGVVPAGLRIPAVLTLHDLWAVHHAAERPPGWRSRYEGKALRQALRRAAHILAVSRSMARELLESTGLDPGRVTPAYPLLAPAPPPDPRTPARLGIRGGFLLSVGTLEPRKNQERLVAAQREAFARTGLPLVLAGAPGWSHESLLRAVSAAGPAVRLAGPVTDAELSWLYANAEAVAQVSRYEGFDYPVAESLRAGRALILSDIGVHREIAGEAAEYVPADEPAGLAGAIVRVAGRSDARRARDKERARRRYTDVFSADGMAPYLEGYRRALGSGPGPA